MDMRFDGCRGGAGPVEKRLRVEHRLYNSEAYSISQMNYFLLL